MSNPFFYWREYRAQFNIFHPLDTKTCQASNTPVLIEIHQVFQSKLYKYPKNQQVYQTFPLQSLLVLLEITWSEPMD